MTTVLARESATLQRPDAARGAPGAAAPPANWPARIVVATHGGHNADHALLAARALAERSGAAVTVATAYVPRVPVPATVNARRTGIRRCEGPDRPAAARLLRAVHEQQRRLVGKDELWPVRFAVGDPIRAILDAVHETGADLVIAGIGRPHPDDRACGDQVPIAAAHHLEIPLYAVAVGAAVPPQRVLVMFPDGVLDPATVRAAWACAAADASLWILVPAPGAAGRGAAALELDETTRAAVAALGEGGVSLPKMATVEVAGDMLGGALAAARRLDAQLIVVPVAGDAGVVRALLPNIAWPLLLTTKRSVLVTPPAAMHEPSLSAARPRS